MNILFLNQPEARCGVSQYGIQTCDILRSSTKYSYLRHAAHTLKEFYELCIQIRPRVVIINSETTMAWLDYLAMHVAADRQSADIGQTIKFVAIKHEQTPTTHTLSGIIDSDPDKGAPRPIPLYRSQCNPPNGKPVIGTFGFGFGDKGYHKLVDRVNDEFPEGSTLRVHMPYAYFGDNEGRGASFWADDIRRKAKPHINVEISHNFLDTDRLIDWLSCNHMNAFFYDRNYGRGIASTIDYALAANRPIAITNSWQFRHIINSFPSINVENTSLTSIFNNGIKPLEKYHAKWNSAKLVKYYDDFVTRMIEG